MSALARTLSERFDHKNAARKLDQVIQAYHGKRQ